MIALYGFEKCLETPSHHDIGYLNNSIFRIVQIFNLFVQSSLKIELNWLNHWRLNCSIFNLFEWKAFMCLIFTNIARLCKNQGDWSQMESWNHEIGQIRKQTRITVKLLYCWNKNLKVCWWFLLPSFIPKRIQGRVIFSFFLTLSSFRRILSLILP